MTSHLSVNLMRLPVLTFILTVLLSSCMQWDYGTPDEDIRLEGRGLFIINEGNFQYGNSTLSYYNPASRKVENEVFYRANGMKLGDVAQSMTVGNGLGWLVVNNSHVVFAIDLETGREKGRIENLTSPRYIHFVAPDKAYISQIWDNRIIIVNPQTYSIKGYIDVPGQNAMTASTEQMVSYGDYVFCNCWSYQNSILKIDTRTDRAVDRLEVGIQPNSLVLDCNGKLWTLCDGGFEGSPYGYEVPALYRIDAETFTIEASWSFALGDEPSELQINAAGSRIFWINGDIWSMAVTASAIPDVPVINSRGTRYYGLTVSPVDDEIYVADAVDYQQQGKIYRYSATGSLIDEFYVGVTPGAFCWK